MSCLFLLTVLFAVTSAARMPYIIRGHDVQEEGRWPWQGSILILGDHDCGCALISESYVLTAAHCLQGKPNAWFSIAFGVLDVKTREMGQLQTRDIYYAIKHPNFEYDPARGFPNDIGIIKLASPVILDRKYTDVISLPPIGTNFEGAECWITGWGFTRENIFPNILQEAQIGEMPFAECKEKWLRSEQDTIRDYHICVGGVLEGAGSCLGDSGGSLSCKLDDTWYLAGVTSWAASSCTVFLPSVYTRISYYRPWIHDMIGM